MRKLTTLTILAVLCFSTASFAQPSNDECDNPILLTDVINFCSPAGAFTNEGATPSTYGAAACFTPGTGDDVWFAFTAEATDVTITVRGATGASGAGGTLQDPQVALYFGDCGGIISELECQGSPGNANISEVYQGGLFVGTTYLIRIQGASSQNGTFQICINNYNPPVDPQSDCPKAAILCDKSSFNVQSVEGAGSNITELNDAECFFNGAPTNYESNSTWFVWTCSQSGSLTFALTPNNGPDDLDFVMYRLPNGIGNCNGKQVVRCMASGQSPNVNSSPCLGPTGLLEGDSDVSEDAGCSDNGDNAWLAPFNMVQGETYALCVNNFSESGNGFSVEFGGSGQFLGPTPKFKTEPPALCLDSVIQVIDQSTFPIGAITSWAWTFGSDAVPQVASGQGPHTVRFTRPGIHPIVMTIKTDLGCQVTSIQSVNVFPPVVVDTLISAPDCNGGSNGEVKIDNIRSGTPPYQFSWQNGPFTSNNTLSGLTIGTYNVIIKDANNCSTELDIDVNELILTVAPDVMPPLCTGDANGVITLNVTNGTAPYQFNFGTGFTGSNTQSGYTAGVYTIQGVDAELCKGTFVVPITDHPPVALAVSGNDVNCFNANDGDALATPSGGVGNFTYLWSDGQTTAAAQQLGPGTYTVTVQDGNGCDISSSVSLAQPPELDIILVSKKDLLCNGLPTGEIVVSGSGGVPAYQYSASGTQFGDSPTLINLLGGDYQVKIRDANGCIDSVLVSLIQPPPVVVLATPRDTLIDLGNTVQTSTVVGPDGRRFTYMWTPDGFLSCSDCPAPVITATDNQIYIVKVTDQDGCMDTDTVRLRVNKVRPIYFPNVFDPETGVFPNNFFTGFSGPAGAGIRLLRVYDRWGALVYEGNNIPLNDPNRGWDGIINGKKANPGVFVWYAVVTFVDNVEIEYSGNVTILR